MPARLRLDAPCPALGFEEETPQVPEGDNPLEGWGKVLESLLQGWL